ncbi:hypothetical protein BDY24DRAFT_359966 [Mrakia frigida]|uniref:HIG1 domain-containing protein n=1 Tax=Mrakia frigida TaxID=29902 RepID=UPI003FCC2265
MKLITQEEADAHQAAVVRGGVRGLLTGACVAIPTFTTAYYKTTYYRTLPLPLKAFGVVIVLVPSMIISAEKAGTDFEKAQWRGSGQDELNAIELRERRKWESMNREEQIKSWAKDHQYSLVGGAWAVAMVGSFGFVWRRPGLTTVQKLINARIIAQTLTIGLMLGAMALTYVDPEHTPPKEPDHSWADMLERDATDKERAEREQAREKLLKAHEKFREGQKASAKVVA